MDLVLPLKREFFDAIKAGTKPEEFRLRNDYWRKRLEGKTPCKVACTAELEVTATVNWRSYEHRY